MRKFFRGKTATIAVGVLALSLLGGGLAAAAPAAVARAAGGSAARPGDHGSHGQPPLGKAEAERARAMVVPEAAAGLPPTAQTFFAVVNANGTLARGFQAVSANRLATGQYQVIFRHDLTGSAFFGTIGLAGSIGISADGQIAVVGRTGMPNGVFVQTFNSAGIPTDLGFHLSVHS